jgi:hypothetical protein
MNLPRELRVRLVEIFLKPELTVTFSGRTSLLDGIDGASSLARDPAIQRHDLELIIRQVASLRRTPAGDIPLVILIDNAMPYVQMFEAGSELGKLREEVVKLHSA